VSLLFGTHAVGPALAGVVETGFLRNLGARLDHADVPLDFILQRELDEAE